MDVNALLSCKLYDTRYILWFLLYWWKCQKC